MAMSAPPVPVSDVIQVWLDVANHPARGKSERSAFGGVYWVLPYEVRTMGNQSEREAFARLIVSIDPSLAEATLDGTRREYLETLVTVPLLILDDFGISKPYHGG